MHAKPMASAATSESQPREGTRPSGAPLTKCAVRLRGRQPWTKTSFSEATAPDAETGDDTELIHPATLSLFLAMPII
jgi:hypothetical protein